MPSAAQRLQHGVFAAIVFAAFMIVMADHLSERLSTVLGDRNPDVDVHLIRLLILLFMTVVPVLEVTRRITLLPLCISAGFTYGVVAQWSTLIGDAPPVQPFDFVTIPESLLLATPMLVAVAAALVLWLGSLVAAPRFREPLVVFLAFMLGAATLFIVGRVSSGSWPAHKYSEDLWFLVIRATPMLVLIGLVCFRSGAVQGFLSLGKHPSAKTQEPAKQADNC
jgi:hypothetical protein